MTTYLDNSKQFEERAFFRKLTLAGKKLGLDVAVFTPEDVQEKNKKIRVHVYDPKSARWKRRSQPFPQVIYDRCRYQAAWRFKQLRQFRAQYPHLTYLNRPLANKWTIHQLLVKNTRVRPHMLETQLFREHQQLRKMLDRHGTIYLKPINGTGGRGILRIEQLSANTCLIQGRDRSRRIIHPQQRKISNLLSPFRTWSIPHKYVIQQGLDLMLHNGRVHDYRLLMQKNGSGAWEATGCAGRVGSPRSITSNLHGGGRAIACEKLLSRWLHSEDKARSMMQAMNNLGLDVVGELEESGYQVCELALDIAIDRKARAWLLEVNPKPSREVFIRSGQLEVYQKSIYRPLEYALWVLNRGK